MKITLQHCLLFFVFVVSFSEVSRLYAQNDCTDAIVVCGNSGYENLEVSGAGIQELNGNNSCGSQENNNIWFDITVVSKSHPFIRSNFNFFLFFNVLLY